jgi:hypothetical protein
MNNLLDYIKVYRKILDTETCNKIIQEKDLKFFPATTQGRVVSHRQCLIKKLNPEFESIIKFKVIEITNRYMKDYPHLITGFENKDTGYDHLLYMSSHEGEYKEHVDNTLSHKRILSCSILLNDTYEGGEFSFFDNEYTIPSQQGMAIVFPSNFMFPHAVKKIISGDRHAIITWMY